MDSQLATWLLYGVGAIVVVILLLLAFVVSELRKPPPSGGTPFVLPNGMRIQQWQKGETEFLFTEIFGSESAYARNGISFEPALPGGRMTIIDAGANIGMFALYAAMRCGGAADVHCFEPIPSTHSVLSSNAESANKGAYADTFTPRRGTPNIVANNVGLSDAPATVVFEHHPHFSVWSTSDPKFAAERIDRIIADLPRALGSDKNFIVRALGPTLLSYVGNLFLREKMGKTERVPARLVRLSDYIDEHGIERIDLLKVDVEGAEQAVLRGIRPEHWARIQQVTLEVESFASKDTVIALMESHGFVTSWFASERERNPGVESQVCMVYATRVPGSSIAVGAASPTPSSGSRGGTRKRVHA